MAIELIVDAAKTLSWDEFCKNMPSNSIALDGFVNAAPIFDPVGIKINFNHHGGVDRLATRSTCEQVLLSIRQGLFKTFKDVKVYVNDCDEDVCLAWFLLKYHYLVAGTMNPLINRLVNVEGLLDTTAGCYGYPVDMPVLNELAWIFEPYRKFRANGQLNKKNSDEYKSIIEDVEHRIMLHITGNGQKCAIDTSYRVLNNYGTWSLVIEKGNQSRMGMIADGIYAYVSIREADLKNETWTYTIGRMSPFIPFDIIKIMDKLNEIEGIKNLQDCWGGGNIIGGSPKKTGSKIPPNDIANIINEIINEKKDDVVVK